MGTRLDRIKQIHRAFDFNMGCFARKADAQAMADEIRGYLRRVYVGVSDAAVRVEGKAPMYTVFLPRIGHYWSPINTEREGVRDELTTIYHQFKGIYEGKTDV